MNKKEFKEKLFLTLFTLSLSLATSASDHVSLAPPPLIKSPLYNNCRTVPLFRKNFKQELERFIRVNTVFKHFIKLSRQRK